MANATTNIHVDPSDPGPGGITRLSVAGFKSIVDERSIDIRPLTVLAGANSSGKSSIMQPLLLFKQTLEARHDPGTFLLDGPNVKFTSSDQLLSFQGKGERVKTFSAEVAWDKNNSLAAIYEQRREKGFEIKKMNFHDEAHVMSLYEKMTSDQVKKNLPERFNINVSHAPDHVAQHWNVYRDRCFLYMGMMVGKELAYVRFGTVKNLETLISEVLHLPGLRGNPERTYPVSAVGSHFPGTFENYVASVVAHWQSGRARSFL